MQDYFRSRASKVADKETCGLNTKKNQSNFNNVFLGIGTLRTQSNCRREGHPPIPGPTHGGNIFTLESFKDELERLQKQ